MIGRKRKDGTIEWMRSAADALSALLSPIKRKRKTCPHCKRKIVDGMACKVKRCPLVR